MNRDVYSIRKRRAGNPAEPAPFVYSVQVYKPDYKPYAIDFDAVAHVSLKDAIKRGQMLANDRGARFVPLVSLYHR